MTAKSEATAPVLLIAGKAEGTASPVHRRLDGWLVPPDTSTRRKRGRGSGPRRAEAMNSQQLLVDLVEQFCTYQHKQRGKTEGGAMTYQWNLEQFLMLVRKREGRPARVGDLTPENVQAWMDQMAASD